MRSIAVSRTLALLIVNSFFASSLAFAQQAQREEIRPRRTQTETNSPKPAPAQDETKAPTSPFLPAQPWIVPDKSLTQIDALTAAKTGAEPTLRIALAIDVRAATVSTNAHLMSATDLAQPLVRLDVARVRLESHLLSPLPATPNEYFSLGLAGLASRAAADEQAKLIRDATAEQCQAVFDAGTRTWGLLIGPRRSRLDAEAAQARLEEAGFYAAVVDLTAPSARGPSSIADSRAPAAAKSNSSLPSGREKITSPGISAPNSRNS